MTTRRKVTTGRRVYIVMRVQLAKAIAVYTSKRRANARVVLEYRRARAKDPNAVRGVLFIVRAAFLYEYPGRRG